MKETYNDVQTGKSGKFLSKGFSWGLDYSIGGIEGEVTTKDAQKDFFGKGSSVSVGFLVFGGGRMYNPSGDYIGHFQGIKW